MCSDNLCTLSIVIDRLYKNFVTEENQKLLDLVFSQNPTQEELDKFLDIWDIEAKNGHINLMLSYLMKEHPELKFRDYEAPRLKGLINFHRCKNIKTLSYFSKVGRELNRAGIVPMLFKGAAMKALRPELSRVMHDVDILVPDDKFEQTISITKKFDFDGKMKSDMHSIDMSTEDKQGQIDIHKFITVYEWGIKKGFKYAPEFNKALFARARKIKAFGVDVLMPSNEDLAFITLSNLVKNITARTCVKGILFALLDLKYLTSKENFDWSIISQNSKITNCELNIKTGAEFIERITPGLLPNKLREELPFEGSIKDECNLMVFNELYYIKFRDENRVLKIKEALINPKSLLKYISIKPKYAYLKAIREHSFLVEAYMKGKYAIK